MDVSTWLRDLGLEDYVQAFEAHHIDAEVLLRLTTDDRSPSASPRSAIAAGCSTPSPRSRAAQRRHQPSRPQQGYVQAKPNVGS